MQDTLRDAKVYVPPLKPRLLCAELQHPRFVFEHFPDCVGTDVPHFRHFWYRIMSIRLHLYVEYTAY